MLSVLLFLLLLVTVTTNILLNIARTDLDMFSMFSRTGPHKEGGRGGHMPENVRQQNDIFWPVGSLYGMLRRLKLKPDA